MINNIIKELDEVKELLIGSKTQETAVSISTYTPSINGVIESIHYLGGTQTALGIAIYVFQSGTKEQIAKFANNTVAEIVYPFVYPLNENGETGSPYITTQRIVEGGLFISGTISIGTATWSGLKIKYR